MKKHLILACALSLFVANSVFAQSGTQKFKVVVPSNISITAPADVTINHDESDSNQAFPVQLWTVKGNTLAGVNVSFSTNTAFTHTTDNTWKRDAQLALSVASNQGPATWNVTQGSDATDYGNSDEVATVTASSNGVGRADFNLAVTFVTDTFGTFAAGDYETTVTGTVSSN